MPLLAGMPKTKQTTGEWTMEALIAKQRSDLNTNETSDEELEAKAVRRVRCSCVQTSGVAARL